MTYLRMDDETGAKFAGDRITHDEAVIALMTTPRVGTAAERTAMTVSFFREWLAQLPKAVSRIRTWASSAAEGDFLRTLGFEEETRDGAWRGGGGMILHRAD